MWAAFLAEREARARGWLRMHVTPQEAAATHRIYRAGMQSHAEGTLADVERLTVRHDPFVQQEPQTVLAFTLALRE